MPVRKVRGGYKVKGTKNRPLSKSKADAQLRAIKANQQGRRQKARKKRK